MATYYHISERFGYNKDSPELFVWPSDNKKNKCNNIKKARDMYNDYVKANGNNYKLVQIYVKESCVKSHKIILSSYK